MAWHGACEGQARSCGHGLVATWPGRSVGDKSHGYLRCSHHRRDRACARSPSRSKTSPATSPTRRRPRSSASTPASRISFPTRRRRSRSPAACSANSRLTNTVQGDIQSASIGTFMAINGDGFFVVQKPSSITDNRPVFDGIDRYTRRGDFQPDKNGFLVNGAGYYLMGIPIDPTTGNLVGSVPQLLQFQNDFLPAQATTQIDYRANLASYPLTPGHDTNVPGSELLNPANFIGQSAGDARRSRRRSSASGGDLSADAAGGRDRHARSVRARHWRGCRQPSRSTAPPSPSLPATTAQVPPRSSNADQRGARSRRHRVDRCRQPPRAHHDRRATPTPSIVIGGGSTLGAAHGARPVGRHDQSHQPADAERGRGRADDRSSPFGVEPAAHHHLRHRRRPGLDPGRTRHRARQHYRRHGKRQRRERQHHRHGSSLTDTITVGGTANGAQFRHAHARPHCRRTRR